MNHLTNSQLYPTTAICETYAAIFSASSLQFTYHAERMNSRDPEEVLRYLRQRVNPTRVLYFRFFSQMTAEVYVDGETRRLQGQIFEWSDERYFIDSTAVYRRRDLVDLKSGPTMELYHKLHHAMDEGKTDTAVYWCRPVYRAMPFRPMTDHLVRLH